MSIPETWADYSNRNIQASQCKSMVPINILFWNVIAFFVFSWKCHEVLFANFHCSLNARILVNSPSQGSSSYLAQKFSKQWLAHCSSWVSLKWVLGNAPWSCVGILAAVLGSNPNSFTLALRGGMHRCVQYTVCNCQKTSSYSRIFSFKIRLS